MTKKDIVKAVHNALCDMPSMGLLSNDMFMPCLSEDQTEFFIDVLLHIIKQSVRKNNVKFRGFGTFGLVRRESKVGYDFAQKKSIPIESKEVVSFKPCPGFFRSVNDEV